MNPSGRHGSGAMGGYTPAEREALPTGDFLKPEIRRWPVSDKRHAEIALQYMAWGRGDRAEYPLLLQRLFSIPRYANDPELQAFYARLKPQIEARMARINPFQSPLDLHTHHNPSYYKGKAVQGGMGGKGASATRGGDAIGKQLTSKMRREYEKQLIEEEQQPEQAHRSSRESLLPHRQVVQPGSKRPALVYRGGVGRKGGAPEEELEILSEDEIEALMDEHHGEIALVPEISEYRKRSGKKLVAVPISAPASYGGGRAGGRGPGRYASFTTEPGGYGSGGYGSGGYGGGGGAGRGYMYYEVDVELQPKRKKMRYPLSGEEIDFDFDDSELDEYTREGIVSEPELAKLKAETRKLLRMAQELNRNYEAGRISERDFVRVKSELLDQAAELKRLASRRKPRGDAGRGLAATDVRARAVREGDRATPTFSRSEEKATAMVDKWMKQQEREKAALPSKLRQAKHKSSIMDIRDPEVRRLALAQMEDEETPFMGNEELFAQTEDEEVWRTDWMFHEGHEEFSKENPGPINREKEYISVHFFNTYSPTERIYDLFGSFRVLNAEGQTNWPKTIKAAQDFVKYGQSQMGLEKIPLIEVKKAGQDEPTFIDFDTFMRIG